MDSGMLQFLAAPFVASLILTGIHAYLGVHVVERGVIFVDLSLAQIAAFGATIARVTPSARLTGIVVVSGLIAGATSIAALKGPLRATSSVVPSAEMP